MTVAKQQDLECESHKVDKWTERAKSEDLGRFYSMFLDTAKFESICALKRYWGDLDGIFLTYV